MREVAVVGRAMATRVEEAEALLRSACPPRRMVDRGCSLRSFLSERRRRQDWSQDRCGPRLCFVAAPRHELGAPQGQAVPRGHNPLCTLAPNCYRAPKMPSWREGGGALNFPMGQAASAFFHRSHDLTISKNSRRAEATPSYKKIESFGIALVFWPSSVRLSCRKRPALRPSSSAMPYTDAQIDTMLASKFNASYADSFWLMVCGFLVFFMQCGFALLEAGTVRAKNTKNILLKNMLDACVGAIIWWSVGFMIAVRPTPPHAPRAPPVAPLAIEAPRASGVVSPSVQVCVWPAGFEAGCAAVLRLGALFSSLRSPRSPPPPPPPATLPSSPFPPHPRLFLHPSPNRSTLRFSAVRHGQGHRWRLHGGRRALVLPQRAVRR